MLVELFATLVLALVCVLVTACAFTLHFKRIAYVGIYDKFAPKLELDDSGKPVLKETPSKTVPKKITVVIKQITLDTTYPSGQGAQ